MTREEELFHGLAAPLGNLASLQVATVSSQATLREVCVKLSAVDVGALLVRDTVGVVGLLTDRDLVHALAAGAHPDEATAESVATSDVLWLSPSSTCNEARDLMVTAGVRHIAVGGPDAAAGIVSARDLLAALDV
jgi:signal-transduction protein with cAMP-binding, CBS, and nucleotidyltransferase domain